MKSKVVTDGWTAPDRAVGGASVLLRIAGAAAILALVLSGAAEAKPIPGDLVITAFASFDVVFSDVGSGNSNELAVLSSTQEGVTSQTEVSRVQSPPSFGVNGANPTGGVLTEFGDGVGIEFLQSGTSSVGTSAATPNFFGDYQISITNNSTTESHTVVFRVAFDNRVDSAGVNAYADSEMGLDNETTGEIDIFFTDVGSDTVFGNQVGGVANGSFGGMEINVGFCIVEITVAPLATVELSGFQSTRGETVAGGFYSASLNTSISVPEPGVFAQRGTAIWIVVFIAAWRRRNTSLAAAPPGGYRELRE